MWEIRKGGKAYAHGAGPHGYSPTVLRDMAKTGYTLYIDGKRQKKPPLEAQTPETAQEKHPFKLYQEREEL